MLSAALVSEAANLEVRIKEAGAFAAVKESLKANKRELG